MADNFALDIMMEQNKGPEIGVAECLIDMSRTTVVYGTTHVDNPQAVSKEFAAQQSSKAFALSVYFLRPGSVISKPAEGQVGFLRGACVATSPGGKPQYAVTPVTAKHNLRHLENSEAKCAISYLPWDESSMVSLSFSVLNWKPTSDDRLCIRGANSDNPMFCEFGVDIAKGEAIESYTQGITSEAGSFQCVRSDFELEKGQKIGMAVFSRRSPTFVSASFDPEQPLGGLDEESLKRIYGRPKNVNIYTGEILLVGDNHIEHNINSFTGCSGAVVFLLDQNQPVSVKPYDFGKAIAVHAGSHPTMMSRNLAFKLML